MSLTRTASGLLILALLGYGSVAQARYLSSDPVGLRGGLYSHSYVKTGGIPLAPELNTYLYARANPLRYIDPSGLWSFSLAAYGGVGGALLFGQDPTTGQWFYGGRLGIGLGGGWNLDPQGKRPGGAEGSNCDHGTTYGDFVNVGGSFYNYQKDIIDAHAGYDTTTGRGYHEGPLNDGGITFGNGNGFAIGGAFGIEVVGH